MSDPAVWDIWSEGYRDEGGSAKAKFHGCAIAVTFKEAVEQLYETAPDREKLVIDPVKGTYYGRAFHDSEEKAREIYG